MSADLKSTMANLTRSDIKVTSKYHQQ